MAERTELGLFTPPDKAIEIQEREEAEQSRKGRIRRRLAFRYLGWGGVLAVLGQWAAGFLWFFWPQRVGAFGGTVSAGRADGYEVGDVKVIREGKFYVTRVPEGFLALWWVCPHLGCTVPWKENDPVMGGPPGPGDAAFAEAGRFNCPCHGSIYNRYGQIVLGPAPRPMDRFPLRIEDGRLFVDTGPQNVVQRQQASADEAVQA